MLLNGTFAKQGEFLIWATISRFGFFLLKSPCSTLLKFPVEEICVKQNYSVK